MQAGMSLIEVEESLMVFWIYHSGSKVLLKLRNWLKSLWNWASFFCNLKIFFESLDWVLIWYRLKVWKYLKLKYYYLSIDMIHFEIEFM